MKHLALAVLILFVAANAFAAQPRAYQATGQVLEIKGDIVVIQKDKEKWEITVDKETQVKGDLKPGAKATIQYQMKAKSVEVK